MLVVGNYKDGVDLKFVKNLKTQVVNVALYLDKYISYFLTKEFPSQAGISVPGKSLEYLTSQFYLLGLSSFDPV